MDFWRVSFNPFHPVSVSHTISTAYHSIQDPTIAPTSKHYCHPPPEGGTPTPALPQALAAPPRDQTHNPPVSASKMVELSVRPYNNNNNIISISKSSCVGVLVLAVVIFSSAKKIRIFSAHAQRPPPGEQYSKQPPCHQPPPRRRPDETLRSDSEHSRRTDEGRPTRNAPKPAPNLCIPTRSVYIVACPFSVPASCGPGIQWIPRTHPAQPSS